MGGGGRSGGSVGGEGVQVGQSMSQKLNGGGRERASQVPDLRFKICNLGPKSAFFLPKTALEPAENGQMKGNSGYSTRAARLPCAGGPSGPVAVGSGKIFFFY